MAVKVTSVEFPLFILCMVLQSVCSFNRPPQCYGQHEVYKNCGPPCPPNCFDLIEESTCRPELVCVKGCFCKYGFYRNIQNECVLPEDCFPETSCKPTEVYDKCQANCQITCENYGKNEKCSDVCVPGCICRDGLVRNEEGNCIPPQYCKNLIGDPLSCNTSLEDFHFCRKPCEQTCQNYGDELNCSQECQAGCICKEGLVRDDGGHCIMPKYCPNMEVPEDYCPGPHETYRCGSPCDTKCSTLDQPCKKFTFQCVNKCFCDEGYARDHRNKCIRKSKCPQSSSVVETFLKCIQSPKRRRLERKLKQGKK